MIFRENDAEASCVKTVSFANDNMVSEDFFPKLNKKYSEQFQELVAKIRVAFPTNRIDIIRNEIATYERMDNEDNNIDVLKYMATLNVLIDLHQEGWSFDFLGDNLSLKLDNFRNSDKESIRYRLSKERNAQFKIDSVKQFIQYMEKPKIINGQQISVKNLIGNTKVLIQKVRSSEKVCEPYVQIVSSKRDKYTGYKLNDIWRYFRYTWAIPYKSVPGRNLFYLVRDALQPFHPVMGIFALGNCVLNLKVRDDDIGWTVEAIKTNMSRKTDITFCKQILSKSDGKTVNVKISHPVESEVEYVKRITEYSNIIFPLLVKNINNAISDIYVKDLNYHKQTKHPAPETIERLLNLSSELSKLSINNKSERNNLDWEAEAKTNLFKRKRSLELAKLLIAKNTFNKAKGDSNIDKINDLLSTEKGRRAISIALIANRKNKIGSNMMEIIVCGSIPPYNELLGGKLISLLACSPIVISDYTKRYKKQVSEIASRMKGKKVVRNSKLVFLGTTSLYSIGSSQYNRIKVPLENSFFLQYRKMGITEGFGTVYFSNKTTNLFSKILELQDGGKRISHLFGEGTSPKFRMISRGLSSLGLNSTSFLKHYSPRIVYSINLAKNTNEFLIGIDDKPDYGFDIESPDQVSQHTKMLIDYWYERWLLTRLTTVNIVDKLNSFDIDRILLSGYF